METRWPAADAAAVVEDVVVVAAVGAAVVFLVVVAGCLEVAADIEVEEAAAIAAAVARHRCRARDRAHHRSIAQAVVADTQVRGLVTAIFQRLAVGPVVVWPAVVQARAAAPALAVGLVRAILPEVAQARAARAPAHGPASFPQVATYKTFLTCRLPEDLVRVVLRHALAEDTVAQLPAARSLAVRRRNS